MRREKENKKEGKNIKMKEKKDGNNERNERQRTF